MLRHFSQHFGILLESFVFAFANLKRELDMSFDQDRLSSYYAKIFLIFIFFASIGMFVFSALRSFEAGHFVSFVGGLLSTIGAISAVCIYMLIHSQLD